MRDAGCQGAERCQLSGLDQLILTLFQLGHHPVERFHHPLGFIPRIGNRNGPEIPSRDLERGFFDDAKRPNDFFGHKRDQGCAQHQKRQHGCEQLPFECLNDFQNPLAFKGYQVLGGIHQFFPIVPQLLFDSGVFK